MNPAEILRIAKIVAHKYQSSIQCDVETSLDDLIQDAALAIVEHLPKFDPDRGVKLFAYLYTHALWALKSRRIFLGRRPHVYSEEWQDTKSNDVDFDSYVTLRKLQRRLKGWPEMSLRAAGYTFEEIGLLSGGVSKSCVLRRYQHTMKRARLIAPDAIS